jgi:hypothetical protein
MADGDKPPFPDPVHFDHGAAGDALEALNTAINQITTYLSADRTLRAKAVDGWQGPHFERFKSTMEPFIDTEGDRLKVSLQALAKRIDQAIQDSSAIQKRHDAANAAWEKDHATQPAGDHPH